jgi:hypothetical protein
MEPKIATNYADFERFVVRQTGRLYARLISWFSADTFAARFHDDCAWSAGWNDTLDVGRFLDSPQDPKVEHLP